MFSGCRAVVALVALVGTPPGACAEHTGAPAPTVPLVGHWRLNLARTHYGAGVDVRRSETFTCEVAERKRRCVTRSVRQDGRELVGEFAATIDASPAPVAGIPDVDSVALSQPVPSLLDATFYLREKPVFAYRAYRSSDGASLMIVSVDPVSRAALTTVVVYDRE
jgi:hypothetical protein